MWEPARNARAESCATLARKLGHPKKFYYGHFTEAMGVEKSGGKKESMNSDGKLASFYSLTLFSSFSLDFGTFQLWPVRFLTFTSPSRGITYTRCSAHCFDLETFSGMRMAVCLSLKKIR